MNQHLDMNGKSIFMATELSALAFVETPTLSATTIEFSDVAAS